MGQRSTNALISSRKLLCHLRQAKRGLAVSGIQSLPSTGCGCGGFNEQVGFFDGFTDAVPSGRCLRRGRS